MKKNLYGNIEDIVVALRAVTPNGEWRSSGTYPRVSTGPDMNFVMLGSEGNLTWKVGEKSTFYFSRSSQWYIGCCYGSRGEDTSCTSCPEVCFLRLPRHGLWHQVYESSCPRGKINRTFIPVPINNSNVNLSVVNQPRSDSLTTNSFSLDKPFAWLKALLVYSWTMD